MKKIISIAFLILLAVVAMAQNQGVRYQMQVRNTSGQLIVNRTNVSVGVFLLDGENGPTLYSERHNGLQIDGNGIVGFTIGNGTVLSGSYDSVSVAWGNAYLKTIVALSDNEQYTETHPLTAVPYAFHAEALDTTELFRHLTEVYGLFSPEAMANVFDTLIAALPTNISEFNNDVPFLLSYDESQILRLSNDTIYITDTNLTNDTVWAVIPARFSGDYNDLLNTPNIPDSMSEVVNDLGLITIEALPANVSAFFNNAGYITAADLATMETAIAELQTLLNGMSEHVQALTTYAAWLNRRYEELKEALRR